MEYPQARARQIPKTVRCITETGHAQPPDCFGKERTLSRSSVIQFGAGKSRELARSALATRSVLWNVLKPLICGCAFTWLFATNAVSQTNLPSPGQLAPKTLPYESSPPSPISVPEPAPDSDPKQPVTNIELLISDFTIDGADPSLASVAEQTLAPLRNRRVNVNSIYAAVAALEQAYVDNGYFLTRVIIPPQHVADGGEMKLQVIHGFIEWLDLDGVPAIQRSRVSALLTPLINDPGLTRPHFERALLLASDLPGVNLKASLRAGPAEGAVILVVSGVESADRGQISFDNALPKALGGASATLSSSYTAPSGPIDQLYATGSAAVNSNTFSADSPRALLIGGLRSAVGVNGAALDATLTWSRTKPEPSPGVLDTDSSFGRAVLLGSYPLIKTRATTVTADLAADATAERENATQFGRILYDDQLRVIRTGLSVGHVFGIGWQGSAGIDVSKGLHVLGARGPDQATPDDPLSQQGASDVFFKWEWRGSVHHELENKIAVDLKVHGQQTNQPLLLSEKFTMGGPADLSAYDTASFSGDRGWAVRGELQRALDWRFGSSVNAGQAYVFGSRGEVVMLAPTAAERPIGTGTSAGLGMRISSGNLRRFLGPLEFAAELAREFNPPNSNLPDRWRAHCLLNIHF